MKRSLLIVVSGPAGSGKTTLCARLTSAAPQTIRRVITCTTRAPRAGEVDGVDYYFLKREEFEAQVAQGLFLEHATVHGNLYGPRLADVAKHLAAGFDALLNVDVQELRRRLTGRGTDAAEEIERRLAVAQQEMAHANEYQHVIESASREADFAALWNIYQKEKQA